MAHLIRNKHLTTTQKREDTIFESPKKHAEFVEHLRDLRTRDTDREVVRESRFGDDNNCIKLLGILL